MRIEVTVTVTAADVAAGCRHDYVACPVARAIQRAGYPDCFVGKAYENDMPIYTVSLLGKGPQRCEFRSLTAPAKWSRFRLNWRWESKWNLQQ